MKRFFNKLIRGWGMLFRALFIVAIALATYFWMDPLSIKDVPFAKLTLRGVIKFFSAAAIILYCVVWFFDFPVRDRDKDPYGRWAIFGVVCLLALSAIFVWLRK